MIGLGANNRTGFFIVSSASDCDSLRGGYLKMLAICVGFFSYFSVGPNENCMIID